MLITIFFFFSLTTILFSLGQLLIELSKLFLGKYSKTPFLFNFLDQLMIGFFSLVLILSILSFVSPLNSNVYVALFIPSFIFTLYRFCKQKSWNISITKTQLIVIIILLIPFVIHAAFMFDTVDGKYYHMQHIESIYQFPIIKGLANLEDRYGFNSSIFLVHSIASFKGILKYHYFGINQYLQFIVMLFFLVNVLKKKDILHIVGLIVYILLSCNIFYYMNSTSNDTTIFYIGYYYIFRVFQKRKCLHEIYLLVFLIPFLLLTIKLSSAILILIILIPIYSLLKEKQYKPILGSLFLGFALLFFWCLRNIYISGYLVYPIYFIDVFDVDWKLPKIVPMIQSAYIKDYAQSSMSIPSFFEFISVIKSGQYIHSLFSFSNFLSLVILASSPFALVSLLWKAKSNLTLLFLYSIFLTGTIFSYSQAPGMRFAIVYLSGIMLVNLYIVTEALSSVSLNVYYKNKVANGCMIFVFLILLITTCKHLEDDFSYMIKSKDYKVFARFMIKPQVTNNDIRYRPESEIVSTTINNYNIMINDSHRSTFTYEIFPSSLIDKGFPETNGSDGSKIQHLKTIELRGNKITDGYRTKVEWIKYFNKHQDSLFLEYKKGMNYRMNKL